MIDPPRRKWIGQAEVRPRPGVALLGSDQVGAFVIVVGLGHSQAEFVLAVSRALDAIGLDLAEMKDIEPFSHRIVQFDVDPEVVSLAENLSDTVPVSFDEFCVFPLNEEDSGTE